MSSDPFSELPRLFRWRDASHHEALCAQLERTYVTAVASTINAKLVDGVRAQLEALPNDAYLSIVRGADTFFASVYGRSEDLARSVARWIVVERAVLGQPIEALPRVVGTNIALDYDSALPDRLYSRFPERKLVPPSADERAETETKLAAAHALVEAVAPLAADLVRRTTDVICCRTSVDDWRTYSASDRTTLGVVHLINTHLPRKTPSDISAELVRESIHQALFRAELATPLLGDRELAAAQVSSPWTGATLDLDAFIHGCFVSYGVANLWRGASAPAAHAQAIARQRGAVVAGFEKDPLVCLGEYADRLPPGIAALIAEMTRDVCGLRAA